MPTVALVLGSTGALLLLAALIGRGMTIGDIALPAVSMVARIPCFVFGGVLVVVSVLLTVIEISGPQSVPEAGPSMPPAVPAAAVPAAGAPAAGGMMIADSDVYRDPYLNAAVVGNLGAGMLVDIVCTAQGDIVRRTDGDTSGLWDLTSAGYVPDVIVDTGTDQATAGPC